MSNSAEDFDQWIRTAFVDINTSLEELYFEKDDPADVRNTGEPLKTRLLEEGQALVRALSPVDTGQRI